MPEKIELSINLINNILGYLGKRPFEEVALLVNSIQQEAAPQIPAPSVDESESEE